MDWEWTQTETERVDRKTRIFCTLKQISFPHSSRPLFLRCPFYVQYTLSLTLCNYTHTHTGSNLFRLSLTRLQIHKNSLVFSQQYLSLLSLQCQKKSRGISGSKSFLSSSLSSSLSFESTKHLISSFFDTFNSSFFHPYSIPRIFLYCSEQISSSHLARNNP